MGRIRWDGDAASAVRAQEAMTSALEEYKATGEKAVLTAKQLETKARAVAELANPQEKYNRKMRELAEAVAKGRVTVDQAAVSAARYQRELDRAGEAGKKAFGVKDLLALGAGLVSVQGLISAVTGAFQAAEASAQGAADAILDSLGAVGEMQQLGPEGLAKGLRIQRELIASGTVKGTNRAQAADIAANLINANLTDDQINLITKDLGGAGGLVKAENMTTVGGNLKGLMTQFGEKDMRDMTARVLVAANKTKADLATTSSNILKFGELASGAGIDLNQAMAGYVASERTAASPEAAAEMQKSFYSQVYSRGLAVDGDLFKTLESIRGKIPKGGTAFDVLGDANAVIGYEALIKNLETLRKDSQDIGKPPTGMITDSAGLLARTDPTYAASQARAREQGRADIAIEQSAFTQKEDLFEAVMSARRTRATEAGGGGVGYSLAEWTTRINDAMGTEDATLRKELSAFRAGESAITVETAQAIERYLARIADGMDEANGKRNGKRAATSSSKARQE